MGGRYWITGVQLGMLKALSGSDTVQKILQQIEDTQFMDTWLAKTLKTTIEIVRKK